MDQIRIIEPQWHSFAKRVIPDQAPEIQIKEMEKAFYSGAFILLQNIVHSTTLHEDVAVEVMDAIQKEIETKMESYMPNKEGSES